MDKLGWFSLGLFLGGLIGMLILGFIVNYR